jgi:cytochrome c-type biogenesis protein CcmE
MGTTTRLVISGAIIVGVTGYMVYQGAATSWQYYLTVDECIDVGSTLSTATVRVSGKVASGTLEVNSGQPYAEFVLLGDHHQLRVRSNHELPDSFAEEKQVVVEGRLVSHSLLEADQVLTKCASKYSSAPVGSSSGGSTDIVEARTP